MEKERALVEAANIGDIDRLRTLIKEGVDVNAVPFGDYGAFYSALREMPNVEKDSLEIVKVLVEEGDLDLEKGYANHETPLFTACAEGNLEVAKYLVEKGADIQTALGDGTTILHYLSEAIQELPQNQVVQQNGKEISDPKQFEKITGIEHADTKRQRFIEIANWLVDQGANIEAKNNNGQTPLFDYAAKGIEEIVDLLLSKNVEVTLHDNWGLTILHYVCRSGHVSVAKKLIEAGADVDAQDEYGFTPLLEAIISKQGGTVAYLLSVGADSDLGLTKAFKESPAGADAKFFAEKYQVSEVLEMLDVKQESDDKWTWNHQGNNFDGVEIKDDALLWFSQGSSGQGGGAKEQSVDDFLKNGSNAVQPPLNLDLILKAKIA